MGEHRHYVWIATVAVIALACLSPALSRRFKAQVQDLTVPFQAVVVRAAQRVGDSMDVLLASSDRREEGERLQKELFFLREKARSLEFLEKENAELRGQLGFSKRLEWDMVPCEVLTRGEAGGWWRTVTLDKGEADGVTENCPVLTPDGVVGKTISVSRHSSIALLLTDRNFNAAAELGRTGEFGIQKGLGSAIDAGRDSEARGPMRLCRLDYLPLASEVQAGDKVFTSGLGGVFPRGVSMGVVESVEVHKSGLYRLAYVRPSAELSRLRYVFAVMNPSTGAGSRRAEGGPDASGWKP